MKKVGCLVVALILFPWQALGFFHFLSFNLNITKNTTSSDGIFEFSAYSGNNSGFDLTPISKGQISTINGRGAYSVDLSLYNSYKILETEQPSWNLKGVNCTSTNSATSFTRVQNGIQIININDGDSVNCVFNNEPNSVKKTPILIVPGITGTEIIKGSELLWADVNRMINPFHDDSFMDPLAFKEDGTPLDNSLILGKVIDKKSKLDYTQHLVEDLKSQGYTPGDNLFSFAYDWRRDIEQDAILDDQALKNPSLKQSIDEILLSTGSDKIDIVAHSQGGLVVKKLLQDLPEYKTKVDKLIFVGTPNLGAPFAEKVLVNGDDLGVHFMGASLDAEEVKKISQNMPAIYQLLPGQEYFKHVNGYIGQAQSLSNLGIIHINTLNFTDTEQFLKDQNLNSALIDKANNFHKTDYDNFDFSNSGIQTYNIVGCQTGTAGKIIQKPDGDFSILPTAGDGTVPVFSASNIPGANTYYALESSHGTMMTQDGIRQKIVNLLTDSANSTNNKITQNISDCHFDGTEVSSHSPVELHVYDAQGRHVGPTVDGGFENQIPNVGYDTIGHVNFAYLPNGGRFTIKLIATGSGAVSFDSSLISSGEIVSTAYYDHINISTSSVAQISLTPENNQNMILDVNGDGSVNKTIQPSAILDSLESQDFDPPISTSTIVGTMGEPGFYRGDVSVNLSATDAVINGEQNKTSGLLKIQYSEDGGESKIYNSSIPITVTSEGQHVVTFFSTDRAGNNELEKTITFTIDKTSPEFIIRFNPNTQDLDFIATDTVTTFLSTSTLASLTKKGFQGSTVTPFVKLKDSDDMVAATDAAGNVTQLTLQSKNRKHQLKADIKSLSYNGKAVDLNKNTFHFDWLYDKNGNLKSLIQQVQSKKDFNILAAYAQNKTLLIGKDGSGKILKTLSGLTLLKIITKQGDLIWSY
jgi:pimeloyl-ACP methyl ester carboxylesterase